MATLTRPGRPAVAGAIPAERDEPAPKGRVLRDSLIVALGGQVEQAFGTVTSVALRWALAPDRLGVYTGLRLYLDNTNRSSLGVGLGAVQQIPVLRAAGREAEARRLADVAYTTNTLTCLVYALGLASYAAATASGRVGQPLGFEWTWGLVAVAALVLLKRHESFLVAILRAHGAFAMATEVAMAEAVASPCLMIGGVWLAGLWGLLGAVGLLLGGKVAYLRARHPLRFSWAWDPPAIGRLMRVGLPIFANTAAFAALTSLDRALILARIPDGERAAGLYTVALMGTGWGLDLAGRVVAVLYVDFQTALGRTGDVRAVALRAARAIESQAAVLAAGAALAATVGPTFLSHLIPKYAAGVPALRPLLPGTVLLGLAWPSRQLLIAVDRPYRLFAATLLGFAAAFAAGAIGADRAGIVGVAWGMTAGYSIVYMLTSAAALAPSLGLPGWLLHQARLLPAFAWFAGGAWLASGVRVDPASPWVEVPIRGAILLAWSAPAFLFVAQGRRPPVS